MYAPTFIIFHNTIDLLDVAAILRKYGGPIAAVESLCPDHWWEPWSFPSITPNFWRDIANGLKNDDPVTTFYARELIEMTSKEARIESLDLWAQLAHFNQMPPQLRPILRFVSTTMLLSRVYPAHAWKFTTGEAPGDALPTLGTFESVRHFLLHLFKIHRIKRFEDLYSFTKEDLVALGGTVKPFLDRYSLLTNSLRFVYLQARLFICLGRHNDGTRKGI